jgi:hypothetical protein
VNGCVPFHEPVLDVNVCPCTNDPEITGGDTTEGATTVPEAAATTGDGADTAEADPFLFVAVTTTRIVAPTSAEANRYD